MTDASTSSQPAGRRAWIWPALLAATVVVESSCSTLAVPGGGFPGLDKIAHFFVFGLLASLILRTPGMARRRWRAVLTVALVSLFGATDEWHQQFTPGRSVEFLDWLADTTGPALAVTLYLRWGWYRRLLETPLWRRRRPATNVQESVQA